MTPAQQTQFKTEYLPLDSFEYLWMAPHIWKGGNPSDANRQRIEWRFEREVDIWTQDPQGRWGVIRRLYDDMVKRGQRNPLIGHRVNGRIYVVKGNRALMVLRAIQNRIHLLKNPGVLSEDLQRWKKRGFDRIKVKVCTCQNVWSVDCPAARFHNWVK